MPSIPDTAEKSKVTSPNPTASTSNARATSSERLERPTLAQACKDLRAAAAAGRYSKVKQLCDRGIPIDSDSVNTIKFSQDS